MLRRRQFLWMAGAGAGLSAAGHVLPAQAQLTPTAQGRPWKILVGYSAGGAVDTIARALAQQLQASLSQTFIVENRPGAGTNIAIRALVGSPPDSQTLMLAANALAANVSLYNPPPCDLARDITPIAMVGRVPVVLCVAQPTAPATLAAWIQAAKAAPRALSVGTPGNGSTPHLALGLLEKAAGVDVLHVPYKGGAQALTDLLGGHVQSVAINALEVLPHVQQGRMRVLAVMSAQRTPILPQVPTVAESGYPGFEASVWYGLVGPRGLAADRVQQLNQATQQALRTDAIHKLLSAAGGDTVSGSPQLFADLLMTERDRYAKLIREAGIQPDA